MKIKNKYKTKLELLSEYAKSIGYQFSNKSKSTVSNYFYWPSSKTFYIRFSDHVNVHSNMILCFTNKNGLWNITYNEHTYKDSFNNCKRLLLRIKNLLSSIELDNYESSFRSKIIYTCLKSKIDTNNLINIISNSESIGELTANVYLFNLHKQNKESCL